VGVKRLLGYGKQPKRKIEAGYEKFVVSMYPFADAGAKDW